MEIKNFRTSKKGLIELLDFLESKENIDHIDAERPSDNQVFYLESAKSILDNKNNTIGYEVGIKLGYRPLDKRYEKKLFEFLSNKGGGDSFENLGNAIDKMFGKGK